MINLLISLVLRVPFFCVNCTGRKKTYKKELQGTVVEGQEIETLRAAHNEESIMLHQIEKLKKEKNELTLIVNGFKDRLASLEQHSSKRPRGISEHEEKFRSSSSNI